MALSAARSRSTLVESGVRKGSVLCGVSQLATCPGRDDSVVGFSRTLALARAISTATAAQRSASAALTSALAQKPQAPSTRTRTPSPIELVSAMAVTRPFFTSTNCMRSSLMRVSAYDAPRERAVSRARPARSFTVPPGSGMGGRWGRREGPWATKDEAIRGIVRPRPGCRQALRCGRIRFSARRLPRARALSYNARAVLPTTRAHEGSGRPAGRSHRWTSPAYLKGYASSVRQALGPVTATNAAARSFQTGPPPRPGPARPRRHAQGAVMLDAATLARVPVRETGFF